MRLNTSVWREAILEIATRAMKDDGFPEFAEKARWVLRENDHDCEVCEWVDSMFMAFLDFHDRVVILTEQMEDLVSGK